MRVYQGLRLRRCRVARLVVRSCESPEAPAVVTPREHEVLEAVRNAIRHAAARNIAVTVDARAGIALEVVDDSHGFDPKVRTGHGLRSLAERAAQLGGAFECVSSPSGTVVRLAWPNTGVIQLEGALGPRRVRSQETMVSCCNDEEVLVANPERSRGGAEAQKRALHHSGRSFIHFRSHPPNTPGLAVTRPS